MSKEEWEVRFIYTDKNGKVWGQCGCGGLGNPLDKEEELMKSILYQNLQFAMNDYTSELSEEGKRERYSKLETCDNPRPDIEGTPVAITDVLRPSA